MARIIYFESALDVTKKKSFDVKQKTILDVLVELGIENHSLSLLVNNECPDVIDLNYELKPEDIVEIRHVLHGNSSRSKNNLAMVFQIAALVAATVLTAGGASPWLVAGITLAGGVASGALRYRAAKMAVGPNTNKGELDVDADNFSVSSATNEARPLGPITVPMGSIRYAPDFNGQPYPRMWGGVFTIDPDIAKESLFSPGLGLPPENWPEILPAGHITTSPYAWPAYPVRIMGGLTLAYIDGLTSSQREDFVPYIEFPLGSGQFSSRPIIVYHHDPADPHYGRLSNLASLYLQRARASSQSVALTDYGFWFGEGSQPSWWAAVMRNELGFNDPVCAPGANGHILWREVPNIPNKSNILVNGWTFDGSVGCSVVPAGNTERVQDYMFNEINGGLMPLDRIPLSPAPSVRFREYGQLVFSEPGKRAMSQVFNFGIGDLTITDDRVQKTLITDITNAELVSINNSTWNMPSTSKSDYYAAVKVQDGADLANDFNFSGPENLVPVTDNNSYNFIYRSSPRNVSRLEFDLEGSLYETTDSGLTSNYVTFETQVKLKTDPTWSYLPPITFQNDGLIPIRMTVAINFFVPGDYEFRIRKVEKDENNNDQKKVAVFTVAAFKWFMADGPLQGDPTDFVGQNVKGLFLVANTQTNGLTDKYTALVEAKCWTYNAALDEWIWQHTRNPAWWFLFFCRGGFKNLSADGTLQAPYSPTHGWVNYPGHPDSTEIMFGLGKFDDEIDIEGIIEWARFCQTNNLNIDIALRDEANETEILEKIANVGRASVSYQKGKIGVVYENPSAIPTAMFCMANIKAGSYSVDFSVANIPSKIIGNFVNRDEDWETETVEALVPFSHIDDLNVVSIPLEGITERSQAQREVNIMAARQYFQRRVHTWQTDHEGMLANRGDLAFLGHDMNQYGYSSRILRFYQDGGAWAFETASELSSEDILFVTIRLPDGQFRTFECRAEGCNIILEEEITNEDLPEFPYGDNSLVNSDSLFPGSQPTDYIFIAGPEATPGKIVRISERRPNSDGSYTFVAVDEDPAMWSYEYNPEIPPIPPQNNDKGIIVSKVINAGFQKLGEGRVKIFWETDGADFVKIMNKDNNQPILANGTLSFGGSEVIVELIQGSKYTLVVEPFVIGQPYRVESKEIIVWP